MTSYSLGVDLGTTFTAAATVDDTGVPTMGGLGNRAMQIPSVVHIGTDGSTLVGELAERQAAVDPVTVVREFKRRMGDAVPNHGGNRPITAKALNGTLLRQVIDETSERMGGPPSHVTLTHPATWTRFNAGNLAEAAELAGVSGVTMRSEPVAAATHYAASNAVIARATADILEQGGVQTVAGGRIDPEAAIDGLRRLADILDGGGRFIADADVSTVPDLIAADTAASAR